MLSTITILTALIFVAVYPLCFLISATDPLKNKFHKFHLGLPNVVGGVVLVFIWLTGVPLPLKIGVTVWKGAFFFISRFYWKKEFPNAYVVATISLIGLYVFYQVFSWYVSSDIVQAASWILGGGIFCAALYAMNLGHWYLNVHGLDLKHLRRATYVFWALVALRFVWDAATIATTSVMYHGEEILLTKFLWTFEGFLINVGLLFGTLLPLVCLYFVYETIKLKNTQAATGILYAILCAVLLGDFTYKYYLIRFGITL